MPRVRRTGESVAAEDGHAAGGEFVHPCNNAEEGAKHPWFLVGRDGDG